MPPGSLPYSPTTLDKSLSIYPSAYRATDDDDPSTRGHGA